MMVSRRNELGPHGTTARSGRSTFLASVARGLGVVAFSLLAASASHAGSVPAWLDDAITDFNKANPASPIQFVDIKDSYVWYSMAGTPDLSSKDIRGRVYNIAYKNGYANTQDEEMVTTGKPPVPNGPATTKKCWTRSFLRDVQKASSTTVERMLTTMVCEDGPNWAAGFRVLQ